MLSSKLAVFSMYGEKKNSRVFASRGQTAEEEILTNKTKIFIFTISRSNLNMRDKTPEGEKQ